MKNLKFIVFIIFGGSTAYGQTTFHKVYDLNDTLVDFNDLFIADSCYYFSGGIGNNSTRLNYLFGKINLQGEATVLNRDSGVSQKSAMRYSDFDLFLAKENQFITSFRNTDLTGHNLPRIISFRINGDKILDTVYNDFWNIDSLNFMDENFIVSMSDTTSLLVYGYEHYSTQSTILAPDDDKGIILIKIKNNGQINWVKKIRYEPSITNAPIYFPLYVNCKNDTILLVIRETSYFQPYLDNEDYSKIIYLSLDANGTEISTKLFQDTQFCFGLQGFEKSEDETSVITYFDSKIIYLNGQIPPDNDRIMVRPVIAKLNKNLEVIWKYAIYDSALYFENVTPQMLQDFIIRDDKTIVFANDCFEESIDWYQFPYIHKRYTALRLACLGENGEVMWRRDFNYFPIDGYADEAHEIRDIELDLDGGIVLVGNLIPGDNITAHNSLPLGYILKTNCLGFLDSPKASVEILSDSNNIVSFSNTSVMANQYLWFFGDGDSLFTDEFSNLVNHQYINSGEYVIKLIAFGCNNDNDTLIFKYLLNSNSNQNYGSGTLLTIFPNPLEKGQQLGLYIGAIGNEVAKLKVTNALGEVIFSQLIYNGKNTYFLPSQNWASGMYSIQLNVGSRSENERIVIY